MPDTSDGPLRILLVEDSPEDAEIVQRGLRRSRRVPPPDLAHVSCLEEALDRLGADAFDFVLLDLSLPDSSGTETFAAVHEQVPGIPIVVMTGLDDEELGAQLVREGAQDYIVKGEVRGASLHRVVRHAFERHRNRIALEQAREDALEAARAKSDFLSAMSHEIRTPLNSVLGMADLLLETGLTAEQGRYVGALSNAGETLLELINGILDLSKAQAGMLKLDASPFELETLLESTLEVLAYTAHKKDLTLAYEIHPDVTRGLVGDRARLRQIVINLVGNAIKFTDQGEIVLSVTPAGDSDDEGRLRFSVRDTGIGIPPDKLSDVFERFCQVDSQATRTRGGTGLGLAISKELVERMDGQMSVESEPGVGSTFSFTARFGIDQTATSSPATSPDGRRALVADDSPTERRILRALIERHGLQVHEVERSSEAVAELLRARKSGQPYAYAFLDCRMPEVGGFRAVRELHDDGFGPERVVILLNTNHRPGDVSECERLGLHGWLLKPTTESHLSVLLDERTIDTAHTGQPDELPPLRILLVDDSPDNRALVCAYLEGTPHQVETAADGAEAVARFKENLHDLVLMDMQMPVMDGCAATRTIRAWEAQEGRERTPILALTAYAFAEERAKSADAGCDAHLTKPIRKAELLEAIVSAVGSSRVIVEVDEEIRDLVPGYLENRRTDVEKLRQAVETEDHGTVRTLGHNMKGTGGGYGFDPISQIGAVLEQAAKQGEWDGIRMALDELSEYLERVQVAE